MIKSSLSQSLIFIWWNLLSLKPGQLKSFSLLIYILDVDLKNLHSIDCNKLNKRNKYEIFMKRSHSHVAEITRTKSGKKKKIQHPDNRCNKFPCNQNRHINRHAGELENVSFLPSFTGFIWSFEKGKPKHKWLQILAIQLNQSLLCLLYSS